MTHDDKMKDETYRELMEGIDELREEMQQYDLHEPAAIAIGEQLRDELCKLRDRGKELEREWKKKYRRHYTVSVALNSDEHERLEEACNKLYIRRSDFIRNAILEALDGNGE